MWKFVLSTGKLTNVLTGLKRLMVIMSSPLLHRNWDLLSREARRSVLLLSWAILSSCKKTVSKIYFHELRRHNFFLIVLLSKDVGICMSYNWIIYLLLPVIDDDDIMKWRECPIRISFSFLRIDLEGETEISKHLMSIEYISYLNTDKGKLEQPVVVIGQGNVTLNQLFAVTLNLNLSLNSFYISLMFMATCQMYNKFPNPIELFLNLLWSDQLIQRRFHSMAART